MPNPVSNSSKLSAMMDSSPVDPSSTLGTAGMRDLIDARQSNLFDAIKKLPQLNFARDIDIPQLAVVGDQCSGKSSVLEAIGRFHFPIDAQLCTRFPIRLNVRPAQETRMSISIEPGDSRSAEDRKRLQQFRGSLSSTVEFGDKIKEAAEVLGVRSSDPSNSGDLKSFTDDILMDDMFGPGLPLVNLIDLPGLFSATSTAQKESGQKVVAEIVEKYIRSKSNLILLVISAQSPFHNCSALGTIQTIARAQPELKDRVVGVITSPDNALAPVEILNILKGELVSTNLKCAWYVARNQDPKERDHESLLLRDQREEKFLNSNPDWMDVPKSQRGIAALKVALINALWAHTCAALPSLISELRARIVEVESGLSATRHPRSTDLGRRRYLHEIARKFSHLTQEACAGSYRNEKCRELHRAN